jgi:hypothetical protein
MVHSDVGGTTVVCKVVELTQNMLTGDSFGNRAVVVHLANGEYRTQSVDGDLPSELGLL